MTQTKEPKTAALRQFKGILQATMTDCADALAQEEKAAPRLPDLRHYYRGKMDGLASILGVLSQLGPAIEGEAFGHGFQEGQKLGYSEGFILGQQVDYETPHRPADR